MTHDRRFAANSVSALAGAAVPIKSTCDRLRSELGTHHADNRKAQKLAPNAHFSVSVTQIRSKKLKNWLSQNRQIIKLEARRFRPLH